MEELIWAKDVFNFERHHQTAPITSWAPYCHRLSLRHGNVHGVWARAEMDEVIKMKFVKPISHCNLPAYDLELH